MSCRGGSAVVRRVLGGGPGDSAHREGFCSLPDADEASGRLHKGLGGRGEVEAGDKGRSQHTTQQVG